MEVRDEVQKGQPWKGREVWWEDLTKGPSTLKILSHTPRTVVLQRPFTKLFSHCYYIRKSQFAKMNFISNLASFIIDLSLIGVTACCVNELVNSNDQRVNDWNVCRLIKNKQADDIDNAEATINMCFSSPNKEGQALIKWKISNLNNMIESNIFNWKDSIHSVPKSTSCKLA